MENIFKNSSWKIESGELPSKKLQTSNTQKNFFISRTTITYLNNIFFDESVRIDIKLDGNMAVMLNDTSYRLNTKNMESQYILIDNWSVKYGSDVMNIPKDNISSLKLIIEPNTIVDQFTIIQDLKISNCNPNN